MKYHACFIGFRLLSYPVIYYTQYQMFSYINIFFKILNVIIHHIGLLHALEI